MLRFFQRESKTIIGAATIVGVLSFVSRFVGFIRDRLLAGAFGAGDTLDVYYAAFKIPDLLFQLIVVGALSASFIPLFLAHSRGLHKRQAWKFANNTIHLVGGIFLLLSIVLIVFAQPLAQLIAPGFHEVKQLRVAQFMRVMFLAQTLLAVSMVFGSILQSLKQFLLYSLAPVLYNAGIIIGALWLVPVLGSIGLAWGVVLGALFHVSVQFLGVRASGYKYQWVFNPQSKDAKEMGRLMAPRAFGLAVNQLMFFVLTVLASTLAVGSLTIFQFAYNIQFLPVGVVGISFAIALFPSLCEKAEEKHLDDFVDLLMDTAKQILYLLTPMTIVFLLLRAQIVRVVVGAGAFDWAATISTADTLAFFALTFIPQALVFLLARAFYALHDTMTTLIAALVSALIGTLAAVLLRHSFDVTALAIGYSLASTINMVLLWNALRQRIGSLKESTLLPSFFKLSVCAMLCGVTIQIIKPVVSSIFSLDSFVGVFLQGSIAGGFGLLMYLLAAHLLKVPEQKKFLQSLHRSILRRSRPQEIVSTN